MDQKFLLDTAQKLKQPSQNAANEYFQKSETMVARLNANMLARTDIEKLVGKNNIEMMKDNHANHARFMASIFKNYNPQVLVDTVLWVFRAYRSHGFSSNYWAAQLNYWMTLIKENLSSESYQEIYPFYEWMQINIPIFNKLSEQVNEQLNE